MPHHSDQPMCIDGIAAYWLDIEARLPEAIEPQVSWSMRVSTKPPSGISRGGASG